MWLARLFNITDRKYLNSLSQAGTIGLHMVSGIVVGTLIGWALDRWLETSPWLTGIFMVIGIVAGFKNVYVDTKRLARTQREEESRHDSSQGPAGKSR
jgi:ATP synthase protein I